MGPKMPAYPLCARNSHPNLQKKNNTTGSKKIAWSFVHSIASVVETKLTRSPISIDMVK